MPDLKLSDEVNIHSLILENTWHFMEIPLKVIFVFSWRRPVEKKKKSSCYFTKVIMFSSLTSLACEQCTACRVSTVDKSVISFSSHDAHPHLSCLSEVFLELLISILKGDFKKEFSV